MRRRASRARSCRRRAGRANRGFSAAHAEAYYLRTGATSYHVTEARSVDLGSNVLGRRSPVRSAIDTTEVVLELGGLDAWRAGDVVEAMSTNVDVYFFFDESAMPTRPAVGATMLSGLPIAWDGNPLLRGDLGDVLRVFHSSSTTLPGGLSARIVRDQYTSPSFTMSDGASVTRTGDFGPVPVNVTLSAIDWRTTEFESLGPSTGPAGETMAGLHALDFMAQPNRPAGASQFSGTLDLFVLETDGAADVATGSVSFGNPFDPGDLLVQASVLFPIAYRFPGATTTIGGTGGDFGAVPQAFTFDEVDTSGSASPFRPRVAPPESIAIDGTSLDDMDAAPDVTLDHDPVVEWVPSATLGAPTGYLVRVFEGVVGGGGEARRRLAARIEVEGAIQSIALPPGLLVAGRYYHVLVEARLEPTPGEIPRAGASRFSSFFHAVAP